MPKTLAGRAGFKECQPLMNEEQTRPFATACGRSICHSIFRPIVRNSERTVAGSNVVLNNRQSVGITSSRTNHHTMSTPSNPRSELLQGLLIAFIGVILLAIAGYLASERYVFLSQAQSAPGVVSALNAGGSHPQVDFTDGAGAQVSYPQGGMIYGYQSGQSLQVFYRSESPSTTAVIDDLGALWGTAVLVGFIGLAFTLAGLLKFSRGKTRPVAPPHKRTLNP